MIRDFDRLCYDQCRMRSEQTLIDFQLTVEKTKRKRLKWKCREKRANYFMIVENDFVHSKRKCLTKNNNQKTTSLVHLYVMNQNVCMTQVFRIKFLISASWPISSHTIICALFRRISMFRRMISIVILINWFRKFRWQMASL